MTIIDLRNDLINKVANLTINNVGNNVINEVANLKINDVKNDSNKVTASYILIQFA